MAVGFFGPFASAASAVLPEARTVPERFVLVVRPNARKRQTRTVRGGNE